VGREAIRGQSTQHSIKQNWFFIMLHYIKQNWFFIIVHCIKQNWFFIMLHCTKQNLFYYKEPVLFYTVLCTLSANGLSSHSDTLSWFRSNQSSFFLLSAACLAEKQNINFIVFGLSRSGLEPTIYQIRGVHANHYFTDAVIWTKNQRS
jgi:hypothetical protein